MAKIKKTIKKAVKKVAAKVQPKVKKVAKTLKKSAKKAVEAKDVVNTKNFEKAKEKLKEISGFDPANCICADFWDPNDFGEVVEHEDEHWHFKPDVQFEDGSIGPGLIRGLKGGIDIERKKKGISFNMADLKRNG